jgi:ubiquinone/menaquinone biosynthesis C-methylase UbiE
MPTHAEQNTVIRDQFSRQAESYAKLTSTGKSPLLAPLLETLRPTEEDRLLDVGCGPGRMTLMLAPLVKEAVGIDLTPQMLDQARAAQATQGITNVRWQQGDALPLPFDDGAFSIVITQATLHHFADPAAVLAEMARVCAPGGRILVNDMTFDPTKAKAFDHMERLRDPSHLRVLSSDELRGLGRAAGLEELTFRQSATPMPLEAVLATSFPQTPEDMNRVRAIFRDDVESGEDRLGLSAHQKDGQIFVAYTMTMGIWRRP